MACVVQPCGRILVDTVLMFDCGGHEGMGSGGGNIEGGFVIMRAITLATM